MDIIATKLELFKMIADVQSEALLERVKQFLKKEVKAANGQAAVLPSQEKKPVYKNGTDKEALRQLASQPMPKSIDLEQLKKEQGYDPERFREVMKNWDYSLFEDQSLEELLNSLTP